MYMLFGNAAYALTCKHTYTNILIVKYAYDLLYFQSDLRAENTILHTPTPTPTHTHTHTHIYSHTHTDTYMNI